ncbi:MAG: hypothetical protein UCH28_04730 [Adlercreutzia sp.]|nr:hypothetical protein [Adlercreutzia sp.]
MAFCSGCGTEVTSDMAFCPNCGTATSAETASGPAQPQQPTPQPQAPQPQYQPQPQQAQPQPHNQAPQSAPNAPEQRQVVIDVTNIVNPKDHTGEFSPQDISDNKVIAMSTYLFGFIGIFLAAIAARQSPYAMFHARQSLKIAVSTVVLTLAFWVLTLVLIVPMVFFPPLGILVGAIYILGLLTLFIVQIICFFQVCRGKAKDAPIVGSLGFMK